jgi:hypothetical protein
MNDDKPYTTTPPNRFVAMGEVPVEDGKAIDIDAPGATHQDARRPKHEQMRKMRKRSKP